MTNEPGVLRRRSRAAMRFLKEQMRALETQGLERKAIAERLQCAPAQVTRCLGAARIYRRRLT